MKKFKAFLEEELNSYKATTKTMQGVVHARDEDHAREIMKKKHGAKGNITLRLKGPVSKTQRTAHGAKPRREGTDVKEISKKTVGSYIKKRVYDVGSAAGRMGADFGIGPEEKKKNREKAVRQYVKYQKGMNRAVDKLTGKAKVPAKENNVKEISLRPHDTTSLGTKYAN